MNKFISDRITRRSTDVPNLKKVVVHPRGVRRTRISFASNEFGHVMCRRLCERAVAPNTDSVRFVIFP